MPRKLSKDVIPVRRRHEWLKLADGEWWELEQGKDFHTSTKSARCMAINWAKSHGYQAQTSVDPKKPNLLRLKFTKLESLKPKDGRLKTNKK